MSADVSSNWHACMHSSTLHLRLSRWAMWAAIGAGLSRGRAVVGRARQVTQNGARSLMFCRWSSSGSPRTSAICTD
eukprot:8763984-Pyramimonas_sp.AAC.1